MLEPSVNVLKFGKLFSFCSQIKCLFFRAGIHQKLVSITNREDPDQTASSEAVWSCLHCLLSPFWQPTIVLNFRTFTVLCLNQVHSYLLHSKLHLLTDPWFLFCRTQVCMWMSLSSQFWLVLRTKTAEFATIPVRLCTILWKLPEAPCCRSSMKHLMLWARYIWLYQWTPYFSLTQNVLGV